MLRKPNVHGGGSKTNKNGLSFEGRTDFVSSIKKDKNFSLKVISNLKDTYEIKHKGKKIGLYTEKHEFYKFLSSENVNYKKIVSKKYLPDGVLINQLNKTIYIIEKKFQEGSGSVDEKLQTCDFKKKIYTSLIDQCDVKYGTEYYYLLNDWYDREEYKDVKEYIKSVGCKYFINEINLEELGIT